MQLYKKMMKIREKKYNEYFKYISTSNTIFKKSKHKIPYNKNRFKYLGSIN